MDNEKKTFEMPVLLTFEIPSIDKLNISIEILNDLTPWA
jgi:hypothetical protein